MSFQSCENIEVHVLEQGVEKKKENSVSCNDSVREKCILIFLFGRIFWRGLTLKNTASRQLA